MERQLQRSSHLILVNTYITQKGKRWLTIECRYHRPFNIRIIAEMCNVMFHGYNRRDDFTRTFLSCLKKTNVKKKGWPVISKGKKNEKMKNDPEANQPTRTETRLFAKVVCPFGTWKPSGCAILTNRENSNHDIEKQPRLAVSRNRRGRSNFDTSYMYSQQWRMCGETRVGKGLIAVTLND